MAADFYLTLPSNASMKMYPDNTLAHYITDLPRRIDLTGEWECGLAEIQYPHTWYNVTEEDVWFFLNEKNPTGLIPSMKLASGYYRGPVTLMNRVNRGLRLMSTDKARAKLSYSIITQKMTLHMSSDTVFTIPYHSALGPMLGFYKSVVTSPPAVAAAAAAAVAADSTRQHVHPRLSGTSATVIMPPPPTHSPNAPYPFRKVAEDVVNMNRGFDTIYVYTDVVEYRIVGDSVASLLRALPVGGIHGATVSNRFTNIHYVPLLYSHFKSIEMDIRDDTGRRVPFEYGRVTVALHFRRRRTGLF